MLARLYEILPLMVKVYGLVSRYYDLVRMMVRPYDPLTSMARSFDNATRYCVLAHMMVRAYDILPVTAKSHGQAAKSFGNCIVLGCMDFDKSTVKHYKLALPTARRFGLLALKWRPHDHILDRAAIFHDHGGVSTAKQHNQVASYWI